MANFCCATVQLEVAQKCSLRGWPAAMLLNRRLLFCSTAALLILTVLHHLRSFADQTHITASFAWASQSGRAPHEHVVVRYGAERVPPQRSADLVVMPATREEAHSSQKLPEREARLCAQNLDQPLVDAAVAGNAAHIVQGVTGRHDHL